MKVLIVSPFFEENPSISRPSFVNQVLIDAGFKTKVLTSEFSHASKKIRVIRDATLIKTIKYKNNKSIIRFISHFVLSWKFSIYVLLNYRHFDRIYITLPFGLTALISSLLCKDKLIVDIVDYWPGSLPFSKKLRCFLFPLFKTWERMNFLSVSRASAVISLSSTFLKEAGVQKKGKQILLGAIDNSYLINHHESNMLRILYVGNVGTLYDFETLISAIIATNLKVKLDIVGDGDRVEWLKNALLENGIEFTFHGIVYDEKILVNIINNIDIGFNGFVSTTASLSYKSVMYMSYGLPIINSMNGDLWDFVKEQNLGFNYCAGDVQHLKECLEKAAGMKNENLKVTVVDFFGANLAMEVVSKQVLGVFNNETNI